MKSKLGARFGCFQCGTKFYDLGREPVCPECGADQREAPARDIHQVLAAGKGKRKARLPKEEPIELSDDAEDDDDDDDLDLLDDLDGDDDDDFDDDDDDDD